jgi:dihydroorotase
VEDRIDVIATDHAPHTIEEKSRPYAGAPAGLPLVQHALPTLFDRVADGTFEVTKVVEKTAHAPATLFSVQERGFIREGYIADLVLVAPNDQEEEPPILSKCGWSPFTGHRFTHKISHTWLNGDLRYADGALIDGPMGRPLTFNR